MSYTPWLNYYLTVANTSAVDVWQVLNAKRCVKSLRYNQIMRIIAALVATTSDSI